MTAFGNSVLCSSHPSGHGNYNIVKGDHCNISGGGGGSFIKGLGGTYFFCIMCSLVSHTWLLFSNALLNLQDLSSSHYHGLKIIKG